MKTEKSLLGIRKYRSIDLLGLAFKLTPVHATIWTFEMVFSGLLVGVGIVVTARFIDKALLVASGQANFAEAIPLILLILLILTYQRVVWSAMGFLRISMENRLREICKKELVIHRASLSYKHIENQETQDLIQRVCADPEKRSSRCFRAPSALCQYWCGL